jgi:hypothetical protein
LTTSGHIVKLNKNKFLLKIPVKKDNKASLLLKNSSLISVQINSENTSDDKGFLIERVHSY